MNFNLLDILILVSLVQGFVFGFAVLSTPYFRRTPNKYLAFSVILASIIGLNEWLSGWGFDDRYYFIDFFGDDVPWILLFYVPVFFYFLKAVYHPSATRKRFLALCLPFLVFLLLNVIIDLDVDFGLYRLPSRQRFMQITYETEFYLALVYSIFLCILAYTIVAGSEKSRVDKAWLKRIWLFTSALILFWLFTVLLTDWLNREGTALEYALWVGVSGFIYWLTYKGLLQFQLAQGGAAGHTILNRINSADTPAETNEAAPSAPAFTTDNPYFQKLEHLIREEHLHRDRELSRDVVAKQLGISPGYLSQIVNAATGNNLASYINAYRVEEAKQMMLDPAFANYNLLAIGREAGFKSKSAFYTTFKKVAGMTPSAFKKQGE